MNLNSMKVDVLEHACVLEWFWWHCRWSWFGSWTLVLDRYRAE